MIKWKRPSGEPLETNDNPETIKYLESLGYTQMKAPKKKAKKNVDRD